MYEIKEYTHKRLKKLNDLLQTNKITIKPSKTKNKKIDIFINNKKTNTIGDSRYNDYPTYIINNGLEYANKRRKLYYIRHNKEDSIDNNKITNSWFSKYLLW